MNAVDIYAEDPLPWLASHRLWAGTRSYDDVAKAYVQRSGHYLDLPPPGALMAVSLEPLVPGLFGDVPSGRIVGLAVLGRPAARNLPQAGTWAELTRFVLSGGRACGKYLGDNDATCPQLTCIRLFGHDGDCDNVTGEVDPLVPFRFHRGTASCFLRVAAEIWFRRPSAETIITYHDRSRHTGCIYKKAGFKKFGVTRAGTRRGTWASRPGRERSAKSEIASKRRWRLDADVVRAGLERRRLITTEIKPVLGAQHDDREREEEPSARAS